MSPEVQLEPHSKQIPIIPCKTTTAVLVLASRIAYLGLWEEKGKWRGASSSIRKMVFLGYAH